VSDSDRHHLRKAEVCVKNSYTDSRLHGYCGKIVESRSHEVRVRFGIKIANEIEEAWIPLRDVRPANW
jgi:hypothetical protein